MSRKRVYIVSYDIADDKRRTAVYNALHGWGERLQYSVWRCDLSDMSRVELEAQLAALIHHRDDQILLVNLGPTGGRGDDCIEALGKPYIPPHRGPKIF